MKIGRALIKKREMEMNIYNSAMKLFKEKGYDNTTIVDICQSAGVSKSTFFNYYRSKEDILLKHGKQFLKKLIEFNNELPADLDVKSRIEKLLIQDFKNSESLKEMISFQQREVMKHDWLYLKDEKIRRKNIGFYSNILQNAQDKGQINKDIDCDILAEMIVAIYFNKLSVMINLDYNFNYEEYVRKMLEIIWSGIK